MDWLFQCNPTRFDLAALLESGRSREEWAMNQGRNLVSPGDRVFFWQTGKEAKLLSIGRVISNVEERTGSEFGRYWVDIAFENKIKPPLTREEALANETLRNFAPFKGAMGTNFVLRDPAIIAELKKTISGRLVPIPEDPDIGKIEKSRNCDQRCKA
jgi:hypothetical protein